MSDSCLFCRIISRKIPADIVFENEFVLAFKDITPQAPYHILVIPRKHIETLNEVDDVNSMMIAKVYEAIPGIARAAGIAEDGYRVVANCNAAAGQTVFHIHFHLLGGRHLSWPPG